MKSEWPLRVKEEAEKRISQEKELLEKAFSAEFAKFADEKGLYFSFGDISWLINTSLKYNIVARHMGAGAGIACFETLIMRFRLYLIRELKVILADLPPYGSHGKYGDGSGHIDYNFVTDFLDLFKTLDKMDEMLKEIRAREGGNYG